MELQENMIFSRSQIDKFKVTLKSIYLSILCISVRNLLSTINFT